MSHIINQSPVKSNHYSASSMFESMRVSCACILVSARLKHLGFNQSSFPKSVNASYIVPSVASG